MTHRFTLHVAIFGIAAAFLASRAGGATFALTQGDSVDSTGESASDLDTSASEDAGQDNDWEDDSWDDDDWTDDEWDDDDLTDLDLADLLEVECTVVSREAQDIRSAAAAVYVVTGDEIRRAGHATVQDALRMVPGMFVSHWTSSDWDVTIRGFGPGVADSSQAYLNQVLVMIDGVVVYTPLFAGMWWGLQDLDMEHIDRIEVIRGPSGILWGANAFHGLINIITKKSSETTGQRLSARYSNDNNYLTLRTSGSLSDRISYSAFARRSRQDTLAFRNNRFLNDDLNDVGDWGINSGGFQFDGTEASGATWRAWARGYDARVNQAAEFTFLNVLDRFEHKQHGGQLAFQYSNPETGVSVNAAYIKDHQRLPLNGINVDIDQVQVEVRRSVATGENSRVMFGVGLDRVDSDTDFYSGFAVNSILQANTRAFLSQTWDFPSQHLSVSMGVQAIDHEFSGFDIQPSLRASWSPPKLGTFWASGSRAIRTPSIEEEVFGTGTLDAESVVAAEAGWRGQVSDGVGLDLALYYNDYEDVRVRSFDPITFLDTFTNNGTGHSLGAELAVDVQASERWTLRGAYSIHDSQHSSGGADFFVETVDSQYPVHLLNLRSYYDLAEEWELDTTFYLVERFDDAPGGGDGPEYWRGDVRLGWQPSDSLRFAFGVQGFNDPTRSEFGDAEVRRLYYVSMDLLR